MKQHFLPRCYLKEFTNKDGKIHSIDLDLMKYRRKVFDKERSLDQVCRSIDYYTIKPEQAAFMPDLERLDPFFIENEFQHYERKYPQIIQKIKNREAQIHLDEARTLIYALVDLKIRNPYFHTNVMDGNKETVFVETVGENYEEEIKRLNLSGLPQLTHQGMIDAVNDLKEKFLNDPNYAKAMHLSAIVRRKQSEDNIHKKVIENLLPCEWIVMKSKRKFITNDNPGISIDSSGKYHNTKFDENFIYFIPLTPSFCLSISPTRLDPTFKLGSKKKSIIYGDIDDMAIQQMNAAHSYYMTKFIFAGNKDVIDSVAENINKTAGL